MNTDQVAMKRVALLISSISSFITPFLGSSINIALPAIGDEFMMSVVMLSWVVTAFMLATVVFLVPFGRLADIHGRKKVFLCGTAIFTLASLLAVVAFNSHLLMIARVLQGLGCAMIFGTGTAILVSVYPLQERGKALGINVAAVYLGLSIGPTLGGVLTHNLGWRSIFVVSALLGMLVIVLVIWKLKDEWVGAAGEGFDWVGSVLYSCMVLLLMYGFTRLPSRIGFQLLIPGALGLFLFIWWELRTESPVLEVRLFRHNIPFAFSNLAALINYSATFAVSFILSLYLQYIKGMDPQQAGLVLVFQPLMQVIFSPIAGRLSDRIEPRIVASVGMAFSALGIAMLTLLSEQTSILYLIACLLILGFGFGLFSSPNTNAVMSAVEKEFYGIASGILGTMRLIGQMLSMCIVTLVISLYIGEMSIGPQNLHLFMSSAHISFMVFAVLCVFGIAASLARGNLHVQESSSDRE